MHLHGYLVDVFDVGTFVRVRVYAFGNHAPKIFAVLI